MSLIQQLSALEAQPLLGPGWDSVATAIEPIRGQLHDAPTETVLRVILLDATLRIASLNEDAVPFLSNAERWARSQSLDLAAVRLCLMWCHEVGRVDPNAVPSSVRDKAVAEAQACGNLEAEWRLALAVGSENNIELMEAALDHLGAPNQAHTRFRTLLDLASVRMEGGDMRSAIAQLDAALVLSTSFAADDAALRVSGMLGQLRLVQGMHGRARPHLEQALALAISLDNPLAILTHTSLLAGLQLCAEEWDAAKATAEIQIPAAMRRGNWMAVADGAITCSTCALGQGDHATAVNLLVDSDTKMRGLAPTAALNLVRARLAELRFQLGHEVFDPLLLAAKTSG